MPKISIIIPVYNVEKYLRQCLDSVVNQTLKDIEIICVDDCSTDNSLAILKEYATKDNRFVILEQEKNQGPGIARNRALDIAKGEYIMFLDPDDWYELETCELCYEQISKNKNDMVLFSLTRHYEESGKVIADKNRLKSFNEFKNETNIDLKTIEVNYINDLLIVGQIYDKKKIIKYNIKFDDCKMFEDQQFMQEAYYYFTNVSIVDKNLYNYRIRKSSSTFNNIQAYKDFIRLSIAFFQKIDYSEQNKNFINALLDNKIRAVYYWYKFFTNIDYSIKKDFYNKIREFFILIDYSINIRDYKKAIGKSNYKKFKNIVKYNYEQYYFKKSLKNFIQILFSVRNDNSKKHKIVSLFGIKIKFKNKKAEKQEKILIFEAQERYKQIAKQLKKKKKLRVLFLINDIAKWKTESLYDLMEKSTDFEPHITLNLADLQWRYSLNEKKSVIKKNLEYFNSKDINCLLAYDLENDFPIDLRIFKPDIVFFQHPWENHRLHSPNEVSYFALSCYMPYFVNNYAIIPANYATIFHKFLYKHFITSPEWKKEYIKQSKQKNFIGIGHTMLDKIVLDGNKEAINNYVIYAPHWSFYHKKNPNIQYYGTFLENGKLILDYAKKHPEINWVFKPHPRLKDALKDIERTNEQIDKYWNEWEKIGIVCENSSYMDLFLDSKALITDCGSFCTEYFCTKKPVIHLISSKCLIKPAKPFKKIIDTFYKAHNEKELLKYLDEVVIKNNDYLKEKRLKILKKSGLLDNYAAKNIIEDLRKSIWGT